jgi:hypothetical protein
MIYSSYLGTKKCNNVICTQGVPGPRGIQGPIGPTGSTGNILNSFTINSSEAIYDISGNISTITWNIVIPFIYGNQFTFTFHTMNSNIQPLFPSKNELNTTNSYIFGTGQAVYQPYKTTISGVQITKYGYIPSIISMIGPSSNFVFIANIDNINNTINYKFIYYNNSSYFENSIIQLNGTIC